jgi:hypothetical protein
VQRPGADTSNMWWCRRGAPESILGRGKARGSFAEDCRLILDHLFRDPRVRNQGSGPRRGYPHREAPISPSRGPLFARGVPFSLQGLASHELLGSLRRLLANLRVLERQVPQQSPPIPGIIRSKIHLLTTHPILPRNPDTRARSPRFCKKGTPRPRRPRILQEGDPSSEKPKILQEGVHPYRSTGPLLAPGGPLSRPGVPPPPRSQYGLPMGVPPSWSTPKEVTASDILSPAGLVIRDGARGTIPREAPADGAANCQSLMVILAKAVQEEKTRCEIRRDRTHGREGDPMRCRFRCGKTRSSRTQ